MFQQILALALVLCPLAAGAASPDFDRFARDIGSEPASEFSAHAVYRIEFGGPARAAAHGLGLSLHHTDLATAIVDGRVGAQGLQRFAVTGLDLASYDPALGQAGKTRYFLNLTGIQWLGIGVATLGLVAVVAGSGGGGDEEPRVGASGGN